MLDAHLRADDTLNAHLGDDWIAQVAPADTRALDAPNGPVANQSAAAFGQSLNSSANAPFIGSKANSPSPSIGALSGSNPQLSILPSGHSTAPTTLSTAPKIDPANLPLSFEQNVGQTSPLIDFLSHGAGFSLYLTHTGFNMALSQPLSQIGSAPGGSSGDAPVVIGMQFLGSGGNPTVSGLDPQQNQSNYLIGNTPSDWHTGITNYAQVQYQNIYPGVTAVYYGTQGQLEYDFIVAPGTDPNVVRMQFSGVQGMEVDNAGNLVLHTLKGDVTEKAPTLYQTINGTQQPVQGKYVILGNNTVGFSVGNYDSTQQLVIDPVLQYSTYLGGLNNDNGTGIVVDSSGNAYVVGYTVSSNFPTTTGAYQTLNQGNTDIFVAKINASGTSLAWSTYIGGSGNDTGAGIAMDSSGNLLITGDTTSTDFPTTTGVVQTSNAGGHDAFLLSLSSGGSSLNFSTYYGGSGDDYGTALDVGATGNIDVVGYTTSTDFPTSFKATQTSSGGGTDAFVFQLNSTGTTTNYASYLGGSGNDFATAIALDSDGAAYVVGYTNSTDFPTVKAYQSNNAGGNDVFLVKLNATDRKVNQATYLGGSGDDRGTGVVLDSSNNAYVVGCTSSTDFPTTSGAYQTSNAGATDAFVVKFTFTGSSGKLDYATYLGGSGNDQGAAIALDNSNNVYITGSTTSTNFPTVSAIQASNAGGTDAFAAELDATGSTLTYSEYLGGASADGGTGIAVDSSGNAYVVGNTASTSFPTVNAYQGASGGATDAFVSKLVPGSAQIASATGLTTENASGTLTVNGSDIPNGAVIYVNGTALVTTYVNSTQVTGAVPAGVVDEGTSTVLLKNSSGGIISNSVTFTLLDAAFTGVTASAPTTTEGSGLTSAQVASFTDPGSDGTTADYAASVTFQDSSGNSHTVTGTVYLISGNTFGVKASTGFNYAEEGSFGFSVTIMDVGGSSSTVSGNVTVSDAAFTDVTAQALSTTEGQGLTGALVATFNDPGTDGTNADYTASVTWTDSSNNPHTVAATVQFMSGQTFGVYADTGFLYTEDGSFDFSVTINDFGGTTATTNGSVTVAEAAFTNVTAGAPSTTEGQGLTGAVVATFTDPGSTSSSTGEYSATVVWTDSSGNTQSVSGTVMCVSGQAFEVISDSPFTFTEEGSPAFTVTLFDDGNSQGSVSGTVTVSDAAFTNVTAQALSATEGQGLTGALVATFTDPGSDGTNGDYTASVTWTDSSGNTHTVAGTVQQISGQNFGVYADTGFLYSEDGSFGFSVTINDLGGTTGTATGDVTVAEAAFTNFTAGTPSTTEGQGLTGAVVATFTDPGSTSSSTGEYSATVVWTDSSGNTQSVSGTVMYVSGQTFAVISDSPFTYAEEGAPAFTVTLFDDGNSQGSVSGTVTVGDAAFTNVTAQSLNATEGQGLTGALVATFTDPGTDGTTGDYTASVTWTDSSGNPQTVTGTVQLISGQTFGVYADTGFLYSGDGSFGFSVTINDLGGTIGTAAGSVTVAEAAFINAMIGNPSTTEGQGLTNAVVATFTDPGSTSSSTATYSATVVWTDSSGNTHSVNGTVVYVSGQDFEVTADTGFVYTEEGSPAFTVNLFDDGNSQGSVNGTVTVSDAAFTNVIASPVTATEGQGVSGALVGTFTDPGNTDGSAADYSASVTFTDSNGVQHTVAATTQLISGQTFGVFASTPFPYTEEGNFTFSFSVSDAGGYSLPTPVTGSVAVNDASFTNVTAASVTTKTGQGLNGVLLATFTDPGTDGTAADYTASVTFTDSSGTQHTVTGTVQLISGKTFGVYASTPFHYVSAGTFAFGVQINDKGGASSSISGSIAVETDTGVFFTDGVNQLWLYQNGKFTNTGGFAKTFSAGVDASGNPEVWFLDGNNQLWKWDNGKFTNTGGFAEHIAAGKGFVAFSDGANQLWTFTDGGKGFHNTGGFASRFTVGFDANGNNQIDFADGSNQLWTYNATTSKFTNTGGFTKLFVAGQDASGNNEIWFTDGNNQIWRLDNGVFHKTSGFASTITGAGNGTMYFSDGVNQIWSLTDAGVFKNTGGFAEHIVSSPGTTALFFSDGINQLWILQNGKFTNTGGFAETFSAF